MGGDGFENGRVLAEDVLLFQPRNLVARRQFRELCKPRRIGRGEGGRTVQGGFGGYEAADEIRGMLNQARQRDRHGFPQPMGVLGRHQAAGPLGLHIAGQQSQGLAKGEIGIADAGMGITVAAHEDQIGVGSLRLPGELLHEGGLAPPGATCHKEELTVAAAHQR